MGQKNCEGVALGGIVERGFKIAITISTDCDPMDLGKDPHTKVKWGIRLESMENLEAEAMMVLVKAITDFKRTMKASEVPKEPSELD